MYNKVYCHNSQKSGYVHEVYGNPGTIRDPGTETYKQRVYAQECTVK
jgi:hypothetical protein